MPTCKAPSTRTWSASEIRSWAIVRGWSCVRLPSNFDTAITRVAIAAIGEFAAESAVHCYIFGYVGAQTATDIRRVPWRLGACHAEADGQGLQRHGGAPLGVKFMVPGQPDEWADGHAIAQSQACIDLHAK